MKRKLNTKKKSPGSFRFFTNIRPFVRTLSHTKQNQKKKTIIIDRPPLHCTVHHPSVYPITYRKCTVRRQIAHNHRRNWMPHIPNRPCIIERMVVDILRHHTAYRHQWSGVCAGQSTANNPVQFRPNDQLLGIDCAKAAQRKRQPQTTTATTTADEKRIVQQL